MNKINVFQSGPHQGQTYENVFYYQPEYFEQLRVPGDSFFLSKEENDALSWYDDRTNPEREHVMKLSLMIVLIFLCFLGTILYNFPSR